MQTVSPVSSILDPPTYLYQKLEARLSLGKRSLQSLNRLGFPKCGLGPVAGALGFPATLLRVCIILAPPDQVTWTNEQEYHSSPRWNI